jgi:hypothetical protein
MSLPKELKLFYEYFSSLIFSDIKLVGIDLSTKSVDKVRVFKFKVQEESAKK